MVWGFILMLEECWCEEVKYIEMAGLSVPLGFYSLSPHHLCFSFPLSEHN